MKIEYTKHAEDMVIVREIPKDLIEKGISESDGSTVNGKGFVHFFKNVGKKVLRIVTRRLNNSYIVITIYFDRRLRK